MPEVIPKLTIFQKAFWSSRTFLLKIAGGVVLLDQVTKIIVRANLELEDVWMPWAWLEPYTRIVHWKNTGASFGFLKENNTMLIALALLAIGAILYYFPRIPINDWSMRLALGLLLGGVSGNLVDRLVIGHVTDFLSVINYNVFNLADVANFAGVIVILIGIVIEEVQKTRGKTDAKPTG